MPNTYDLSIGIDSNHQISVTQNGQDASDLVVAPGDTINFTCPNHEWAVQFIGEGVPGNPNRSTPPLNQQSTNGASNASGSIQVNDNAATGNQWDYVVAVHENGMVYTRDPDIRIQPRGS
jgi:hypothetical protein